MLAIDLIVAAAVLGLVMSGAGFIRSLRKKQLSKDLKHQQELDHKKGAQNLTRLQVKESMRCVICDKETNADIDVFADGRWWHRDCYRQDIESRS